MKVGCRNCGEVVEIQAPEPKRFHFHFGFRNLWDNLFSEGGVIVMFIICGIGIPALMGAFHQDSDYDAIKKVIDQAPGTRVEVFKGKDKIEWKILKGEEPGKK